MQGVVPHGLVVVAGRGQVPGWVFPLAIVAVAMTFCAVVMVMVIVIVMGKWMIIRTPRTLDPG